MADGRRTALPSPVIRRFADDLGGTMNGSIARLTGATAAMLLASLTGTAAPAYADKPTGQCTSSYTGYAYDVTIPGYDDISTIENDPLLVDVAPIVDTNGDYIICFKPYPNDVHKNGHAGNVTDNMAAPHS
jgi:hypothetical protein